MSDAVKAASPGNAAQLLTTPTPAAQATAGSSASGSSTGSTILLQTPPPALSALSAGQQIRAIAIGRTADGKTLLDTRFGQLALELPMVATRGQVLRLQIVHAGLPLELNLLAASDEPDDHRPTAFSDLKAGATLTGRFRAGPAPAPGNAHASQTETVKVQAPTHLNLRLLAVTPPGKPVPTATGDELLLTGTVTGAARNGGTVLQTATGTLVLPTVANAPKGAQITLQILGTPGTILPATPAGAQVQSISALTHGWQTLQDAIEVLTAADPERAPAIIQSSLPTTGPRLAAGLGFLLNAVFGAKMQDWLGRDLIRTLETQRYGNLVARLTDDFTEITRIASEPLGNEWRTALLPLMHDGALHQIRLYLRAHGDGANGQGEPGDEDAGTRFVVEVELSRLGALQLDGLVRPKRFDLMVRTHQALPDHIREEIGILFAAANETIENTGQIAFQVTTEFPVTPLEPADVHTVGVFA